MARQYGEAGLMQGSAERMAIVVAAASERVVTADELARRLDVTTRTIYRYVARLKRAGVRIRGEAGVGYMLVKSGGQHHV
jgi:predicted DNA-binding transcriptional regulator YafY